MSPKRNTIWFHLFDVLLNIVIIVGIVVGIRTFLVSPFQVQGNSMVDTLEHGEYIIINKLAYYLGDPERGDTVVFRPPNVSGKHYVKRIIGLPGDEVIIRDGKVFVRKEGEGETIELSEPYLNEHNADHTYGHPPSSGDTREHRYVVPESEYFLLGDNRQASLDSRSFAESDPESDSSVPRKNIKGRVWFILLPITKIHALEMPTYGF